MEKSLNQIFEHLHHHPEVSWQEVETTQFIAEQLTQAGLTPILFEGMTGLYVDIGPGIPKVGFRTDIDALWQEVDGIFKANHSCGHDGHMTMALGVAFALQKCIYPVQYGLYSNRQKKRQAVRRRLWNAV